MKDEKNLLGKKDEMNKGQKPQTEADELGEKWLEGMIGEGIHTGLRKCLDSKQAMIVHRAISELTDEEWGIVVRWVSGIIWEDIQAEIDRLKAELAENQALCDGCKCVATLKEAIRRLKVELAGVSEMLKKYGRHIPPCQGAAFPNCTCGFNEAKEKR